MCGTPVISTNWGGFVETVNHGMTGYRVSDAKEAAERIGQLDRLAPNDIIRKRTVAFFSMRVLRHEYQRYFERLATL
jgi:glycosyltransferase involved in cell wall biosynthesis